MRTLILILCLSILPACTPPPPNLSPAGVTAFQATKVIKALDVIRDVAVDASTIGTPPLLAHDTMLKIVAWHRAAITIAHDSPTGWKASITTSLTQTQALLTPAEHTQLDPYFTLAKTVLSEVP